MMQITIKTIIGRTIPLQVEPAWTIRRVKECIEDKEGLPPDEQMIVYAKRELHDEQTLEACEIGENFTLFVVRRKRTVDHFKELAGIFPLIGEGATEEVFYEQFVKNLDEGDFREHEYYGMTSKMLERIHKSVGEIYIEPLAQGSPFSDPLQSLVLAEDALAYVAGTLQFL